MVKDCGGLESAEKLSLDILDNTIWSAIKREKRQFSTITEQEAQMREMRIGREGESVLCWGE